MAQKNSEQDSDRRSAREKQTKFGKLEADDFEPVELTVGFGFAASVDRQFSQCHGGCRPSNPVVEAHRPKDWGPSYQPAQDYKTRCTEIMDEHVCESAERFQLLRLHDTSIARPELENHPHVEVENFYPQDEDGDTDLHIAILDERPCFTIIDWLVRSAPSSACLNVANNQGLTALHLAICTDQPDVVRLLVEAGASVDACEYLNYDDAVLLACRLDRLACLEAIVEGLKARPHAQQVAAFRRTDLHGLSCLHLAVKLRNTEIFYYLLHSKCPIDVNQQERKSGKTALHMAAESGNVDLVVELINNQRVDVNALTYSGRTAYEMSCKHKDVRDVLARRMPAEHFERPDSSSSSDEEMDTEQFDQGAIWR